MNENEWKAILEECDINKDGHVHRIYSTYIF